MKPVTPEMAEALALNLTYLCRLWTIKRKDGQLFRFTDHDRDVTYAGEIYTSKTAFQASAIQTTINSAAGNLDVSVLLAEGSIEYLDLERGMFDDAHVSIDIVSYKAPEMGAIAVFEGVVYSVQLPNTQLGTLQLVGGVRRSARPMVEHYSPSCRASFGDERCKFDLATVTETFTITTAPTGQTFTSDDLADAATNLYALGTVTWTAGDNVGTRVEVAGNNAGLVSLLFKPPFPMKPGDTGTITRGCPKTTAACIGYNNLPNYRGEPFVPGDDGLTL